MIAAGILFQRYDDGRFLLALRSQDVTNPGLWNIPGGHAEKGESPLDTAIIEASEELGPLPMPFDIVGEYPSRHSAYITFHAMIGANDAKAWTPTLNWENDDWGWFSVAALPEDIHPGVLTVLESMRR